VIDCDIYLTKVYWNEKAVPIKLSVILSAVSSITMPDRIRLFEIEKILFKSSSLKISSTLSLLECS